MTIDEAIKRLKEARNTIQPFLYVDEAIDYAVKSLEKEPCEDCISRQEALNVVHKYFEHYLQLNDDICLDGLRSLPSVTPKEKTGHWILTQRDKYIDINCSKCGNTRIKGYAYGYTIDELNLEKINNFIAKTRMNYCECCGAKMEVEE